MAPSALRMTWWMIALSWAIFAPAGLNAAEVRPGAGIPEVECVEILERSLIEQLNDEDRVRLARCTPVLHERNRVIRTTPVFDNESPGDRSIIPTPGSLPTERKREENDDLS